MPLTQMEVTNAGILNINRKIIDSRKYDKNLISSVGEDIVVIDGTASRFDQDNYLFQSIYLENKNTVITCSGNLILSGTDQIVYSMTGENGELLELHFDDKQVKVVLNSKLAVRFSNLPLYSGMYFSTILETFSNKFRVTLILQDTLFEKEVELTETFNPSKLNKIYLGNDTGGFDNYWRGSLNLNTFTISQEGKLVYSPSTSYSLIFSKILVSDEEFPLTNDSVPIRDHIIECKIEEITRSGGSLLLKSEVDKDASITIKEIGLYATVDGEEILFSLLKGVNINKTYDSSYELIIALNLYISFMHVVGFPNKDSFKLVEPKYVLLKDFQIVRDLNLYLYTNYERIIKNNALEIGYNAAETFYELQTDIGYHESYYSSAQSCLKILQKLKKANKELKQFYYLPNYDKIRYTTKDLCNIDDYNITFTYKSFKGNRDLVHFSEDLDNSLCIKAHLKDEKSKLLLSKTNLINDPYFNILFADKTLYIILNNIEKTIVISKEISDEEISFYVENPILISLIKEGTKFALYKNEELIAEFNGIFGNPYEYPNYYLCNHAQYSDLVKICNEVSLPKSNIDIIQDNYDRYVEEIIFIKGALSKEELKYINLLMGTKD